MCGPALFTEDSMKLKKAECNVSLAALTEKSTMQGNALVCLFIHSRISGTVHLKDGHWASETQLQSAHSKANQNNLTKTDPVVYEENSLWLFYNHFFCI